MEFRIVDFELLTRHYITYQNGVQEIEDVKKKFIDRVEPFRKEMQNIILSTQGGLIVDNLSQQERAEKFQKLQQEALEVDKEAKIKLKEMGQDLNEKVYSELELIISNWSIKNSIDVVLGKLEVVYLNEKFEATNDILVLASHFNGLLNFGSVKVSVKYNYVEFVYSRDLLTYSLYPGEINSDTDAHFDLTKDVFWSFNNMIETGEDPVFIFSELLRKKEEEKNTST
jgi:Skp family chaperone for outer membrane proteins